MWHLDIYHVIIWGLYKEPWSTFLSFSLFLSSPSTTFYKTASGSLQSPMRPTTPQITLQGPRGSKEARAFKQEGQQPEGNTYSPWPRCRRLPPGPKCSRLGGGIGYSSPCAAVDSAFLPFFFLSFVFCLLSFLFDQCVKLVGDTGGGVDLGQMGSFLFLNAWMFDLGGSNVPIAGPRCPLLPTSRQLDRFPLFFFAVSLPVWSLSQYQIVLHTQSPEFQIS